MGEAYEKTRRHSVKSSKSSSVLVDMPFYSTFFLIRRLSKKNERNLKSKLFIEKNGKQDWEGGGCKVETIARKKLSIFCASATLGMPSVEEAALGIASSASHNLVVMAFDSCSDNCNDDRAAFFTTGSSY